MGRFTTKFDSLKQEWATPDSLFVPLNEEFGFTLDVAASSDNAKCRQYIDREANALSCSWQGVCWLNPPYGDDGYRIVDWVKKAHQEATRGCTVVMLVPARTNTNWWHDYCMKAEVRFIRGRPKFGNAIHGLPQPLAIVIFRAI